jgi:hypothetical protein
LIIKRSIKNDGNIKPEAYNLLNNLPDEVLFHKLYGSIHPLGIYNRSLSRISKNFLDVLNELKQVKEKITDSKDYPKDFKGYSPSRLLGFQKELLYSIQSHFDDCFRILKVTSPCPDIDKIKSKRKKSMERSLSSWLFISKHPSFLDFKKNIQEYKSFIDLIVNKLKHEQGNLRDIVRFNEFEIREKRLGYFVETGISFEGESVGPDLSIHINGKGFSYSRDLSVHFYNIYEISHYLKDALIKSFKKRNNISLHYKFYFKEKSNDFNEIAGKLCKLNLRFFNEEYAKPLPIIEWNPNDKNRLILALDKKFRLNNDFFGKIRTVTSFTPDGTTKKFRFP